MTHYYIFKTDNISKKTIHVCNGAHETEHECRISWQGYLYGFMDGAFEMGRENFQMMEGSHKLSFQFSVNGKMNVEYFMLFDEDGVNLIKEIA